MNYQSPFIVLTPLDVFETLDDKIQYIIAWKTGMNGFVKSFKSIAKDLNIPVEEVIDLYELNINKMKSLLTND